MSVNHTQKPKLPRVSQFLNFDFEEVCKYQSSEFSKYQSSQYSKYQYSVFRPQILNAKGDTWNFDD